MESLLQETREKMRQEARTRPQAKEVRKMSRSIVGPDDGGVAAAGSITGSEVSFKTGNDSSCDDDKDGDDSGSESNNSSSPTTDAEFFPRPRCVGCDEEIRQPCWYCVTCGMYAHPCGPVRLTHALSDADAFVCDDCDSNDEITFSDPHELSHPIVRCHRPPSDEPKPAERESSERIADMEKEIASLNERLSGLEKQLEGSQNALTEKLVGIEALLSKVVSKLAA
jgi:hypothetical protein